MAIDSIVVHCSATKDSGTVSWDAIRKYHMREKRWSDIGYHFGIEMIDSNIVILRGRHPATKGAHCRMGGYNSRSLGVCVVGKYEDEPPSKYLLNVTIDLLTKLCFLYGVVSSNVLAHSEIDDRKTCPGAAWSMELLRAKLYRNLLYGGVQDIQDINVITEYSGDRIYWR